MPVTYYVTLLFVHAEEGIAAGQGQECPARCRRSAGQTPWRGTRRLSPADLRSGRQEQTTGGIFVLKSTARLQSRLLTLSQLLSESSAA
jgi:hypothetical protein